jgi:hypothetical protein
MTKSYAFHSGYFNGPDDNPDLDHAEYCRWLDSLDLPEMAAPPARAFESFDAMLDDADAGWSGPRCIVCGWPIDTEDGQNTICDDCVDDLAAEGKAQEARDVC